MKYKQIISLLIILEKRFNKLADRFEVTEKQGEYGFVYYVIVDIETGVNYLAMWSDAMARPVGLTVLVDKDGKPIIGRFKK